MGAKIYVIKLKQILRAVLSLVVLAVIIIAVSCLVKKEDKPTFSPGVYTSSIILHNSPVNVEVEVSKHAIENIRILDLSETQEVFYPLFSTAADDVIHKILDEQSCDISVDSDFSVTSGIITDAVRNALSQAENK
ncbi:MAG: hypothetical protein IJR45_01845 [Firmicutes bacterium]|nr:hypothetical protein [Bacillota bacterium]